MARNKTAITIALVLTFALVVSAIPFVSAQNYNIYIEAPADTGAVIIEVRIGSTNQQQEYTGVELGYLAPGGSWVNVTGLTMTRTSVGGGFFGAPPTIRYRVTYNLHTLKTNGVWHFQAKVPAPQFVLPANPATPDGSWYSPDYTFTTTWQTIDLPTFALVNAAPNPIGKDQIGYLNIIMSKVNIGSTMSIGGTTGAHYTNLYMDVTRPDGIKETFGPRTADPTGGMWFSYTPATAGNYTVQGRFPGQDTRDDNGNAFTSGNGLTSTSYIFRYLADESPILTWVVQEQPVGGWNQPPLPTEYWSRPITATNWAWGTLEGSNWWGLNSPSFSNTGGYDASGNVQLYGKAPNSAHIMWTKSTGPGGQPGGSIASDQEGQFTSTSITRNHWNPIIIYGMLIGDKYPGVSSPSGLGSADNSSYPKMWWAIDIRTGEVVWERDRGITRSETLRGGWIQKFHSVQEFGSWAALIATTGSMGYLYDPWTGAHMGNVTNVNWGSAMINSLESEYRQQGGMLRWYTVDGLLTMWNSTKIWSNSITGQRNWTSGYQWQVNATATYPAGTPTGIRVCGNDVLLLNSMPSLTSYHIRGYMTVAGVEATTGKLLWGPINYTLPATHDISMYGAREGVFTLYDKDTQEAYCYSLKDGTKLWGPVSLAAYTNTFDYVEMDMDVYNGVVVFYGFGSNVVGLNATTGEIMWHFTRGSAGFDTPHGEYPIWDFGSESFADGKAFFSEGSMYDVPLHPARRLAINVTDGSLVWSILSFSGRAPGAIADGYLLEFNSMSYELVCFGKGPTATTALIENDVTTFGHKVVVKGMVTDISPGTEAYNREARFPHGVAAVSEESQREWMEYVYMQQAKPAATGVPVTISVYDPNGNTYDVGTATSNGDGFYTLNFVPEVPGEYIVTAKYAGSESYWGSFAQTSLFVEEAPAASPTPTPPPATMTDTYVTGFGIGMIIAIVVVGLLLFMLFRKR